MRTGALARVVAITALVAGCNPSPSAPPTAVPGSLSAGQTPGAAPTTGPVQTPGGSPGGAPTPSSLDLLTAALANGSLDFESALLYRFYAAAGDGRLPAEFAGPAEDDPGADRAALAAFDTLSSDTKLALLPFLVRPTDPASWYAAAPGGVSLANVQTRAAVCENGWIRKQTAGPARAMVWGQCGGGSAEAAVEAQVDAAVAAMEALWTPMTDLMGPPIGDQNVANDGIPDSAEAGDGLIDIYLVDRSVTLHGRNISTGAEATTRNTPPYAGPAGAQTGSSFVVVNSVTNTGLKLKSTLAHEFFHVLENAHNDFGVMYQVGGSPAWLCHWFMEAAAVWAEHQFVPEARATEVYPRFTGDFLPTTLGLSDVASTNEYASFLWPLFMEQEIGPWAIRDAWQAMEGKDGFEANQAALDSVLSFRDRFRDFAVRVFNADLQPGDPIDPRFQDLDHAFPADQPSGSRASYRNTVVADAQLPGYPVSVASLGSKYWDVVPDSDTKELTFDFFGLAPAPAVAVDLLLLRKGQWERRQISIEEEDQVFCDVTHAIVVISNHSQDPMTTVEGRWAVSGRSQACQVGSWTVTLTGPMTGAGTHTGTGRVTCTRLDNGGTYYWGASMVDLTAAFGTLTDWSMSEEPGKALISATVGGLEGGVWLAYTGFDTATVTGSGAPGSNAHVSGHGTFRFGDDRFTIDIAADCSDTYY